MVIDLKKDAYPKKLLNQLYKLTPLQDTFSMNNIALVNRQPRTLGLLETIKYYIEHRVEVIRRRTNYLLAEARKKAHVLEGLVYAVCDIDEVIKLIRASRTRQDAIDALMARRFRIARDHRFAALMPARLMRTIEAAGTTGLALSRVQAEKIGELRLTAESTPDNREYRRVVTGNERLPADAESRARAVLALIDAGTADVEALLEGAQICHDFLGQALFTDLTGILYEGQRRPGPIHQAIAELAAPIAVADRGGVFPGWDAIITYNFDDLMGEALDELGLARAAYAMRGRQLAGDPNEIARQRGPNGLHQPIYHLHGYTPRRLFLITQVEFVFATSQYTRTYGGSLDGIVGEVFARCLANPVRHALYVGCSFDDEAMNDLLRQAARALPGRYHYALLRWPGDAPFATAAADEVAHASARYVSIGVRPIWFDDFSEIPGLIRSLA